MPEKVSVGITSFERARREGFIYVDKSLMIRDVLESNSQVFLFLRPRRFGKTINLDMLDFFFNTARKPEEGGRDLFEGLKIESDPGYGRYKEHRNAHPVIRTTLTFLNARSMDTFNITLRGIIREMCADHAYMKKSDKLDKDDLREFKRYSSGRYGNDEICQFPPFLCRILHEHHGTEPVILMDEYDAFIQTVPDAETYDSAMAAFKKFMEACFKSNPHLFLGVATGVLRIAKSGAGSGFNNADVYDTFNNMFDEHYGFTEDEVRGMLARAGATGIDSKMESIREWYDSYHFGDREVYNPKSVVAYINRGFIAGSYWEDNTDPRILVDAFPRRSARASTVVRSLLERCSEGVKSAERCMVPRSIDYMQATRGDGGMEYISMLIGYGYLTAFHMEDRSDDVDAECDVTIPNKEVGKALRHLRDCAESHWKGVCGSLMDAIRNGDGESATATMGFILEGQSFRTGWTHDRYRDLVGMVLRTEGMRACEEVEKGDGYADVYVDSDGRRGVPPVVIEVKSTSSDEKRLESLCDEGLRQIEDRGYARGMEGCVRVAMAFHGKTCRVRMASSSD